MVNTDVELSCLANAIERLRKIFPAELEEDLEKDKPKGLADLDGLLAESLSVAATKKAHTKKFESRRFSDDLPPLDSIAPLKWRSQFFCAIFIQQHCQYCGSISEFFSHFAEYQISANGQQKQWLRQAKRPAMLAAPQLIRRDVAACGNCISSARAIAFASEPPKQLLLWISSSVKP